MASEQIKEHIKQLHVVMVEKICGELSPGMTSDWAKFKNAISSHLSRAEIVEMKTTYDGIESLMKSKKIDFGKYEVLREIFKVMKQMQICQIIDEYTGKMSNQD